MRVQGAIDKMLSPLRSKEQMLYQLSTQVWPYWGSQLLSFRKGGGSQLTGCYDYVGKAETVHWDYQ